MSNTKRKKDLKGRKSNRKEGRATKIKKVIERKSNRQDA